MQIKVTKTSFYWITSVLLGFYLSSCSSNKMLVQKLDVKTEEQAPQVLFQKLQDSSFVCSWLNAKLTVSLIEKDKKTTVNASLRMKTDSLIWISITGLGIEMIKACLSKDSLKLIDRINSKYIATDPSYINEFLQVPLTFEMFQALVFGNFFPYIDEDNLRKAGIEKKMYKLSTSSKKKFKKDSEASSVVMELLMDPNNYRVMSMEVNDTKNKKTLETAYGDYKYINDRLFPYKTELHTEDKTGMRKPIRVQLEYTKVTINKPQTFPFNIPTDYIRVK